MRREADAWFGMSGVVIWSDARDLGFSRGCGKRIPRRFAPRNDNKN
jgi:hypothetical protein